MSTPTTTSTPPPVSNEDSSEFAANAVNTVLTPAAPKTRAVRTVENKDFAGFCRRILAAHAKRVGTGDIEALTDLVALSAHIDTAIGQAVQGLRAFGYSWADIARPLGLTKQAAQQRWGRIDPLTQGDPQ